MRFLRIRSAPAAAVAGLALASLAYTRLSLQSVVNSDGANEALQGLDFWHGNVLLRGWWLAQDTFYLTDAPLYGLIARVQGLGPAAVHEGAAIVYAAAVVVAALLAGRGALITVAVLALPPPLFLQGQMHILGVVYALTALLLIERPAPGLWNRALARALLTAAMVSDPLVTLLFAPALAIVAAARTDRRRDLLPVTAVAAVVGTALPKVITLAGGFTQPRPVEVGVANPAEVASHLGLLVRSLLNVFHADVVDTPADALAWVRLAAVAAVAAGIALAVARRRTRAPADLVAQVLLLACAIDVAAFLFTTQAVNLDSSRFLSPFAICAAVLAGRELAPAAADRRAIAACAVMLLALGAALLRPPAAAPAAGLERWLIDHRLSHGLGAYWDSSIVTLDTGGRVTVRCVDSSEPDRWFQNSAWFEPGSNPPATFVVFSPGERPANIDERGALAAFGPPAEIDRVGSYEVLVYSRDLLAGLRR